MVGPPSKRDDGLESVPDTTVIVQVGVPDPVGEGRGGDGDVRAACTDSPIHHRHRPTGLIPPGERGRSANRNCRSCAGETGVRLRVAAADGRGAEGGGRQRPGYQSRVTRQSRVRVRRLGATVHDHRAVVQQSRDSV